MNYSRSISFKIILTVFVFLLLATVPEKLSRSALPHHMEVLSSREENRLFRMILHEQVKKFDEVMNRFPWFNGNVMVVKNHQIVYEHCQGYSNWQTRELLVPETAFELASVSKQFTAVAILILYERGQLDLDDPIQKYIPEITFNDITIRHLLNHTSGLPNYMWLLEEIWELPYYPSNQDMIVTLKDKKATQLFRAGRRHSYSNTGYALLASVVERISQQSFTRFLRKNIFEPLDMRNTFTSVELIDSVLQGHRVAAGHKYARKGSSPNPPVLFDKILGDKGIHSTIEDLYKWDQALYSAKIIRPSTLEKAYEPALLNQRYSVPYGFGFRIGNNDGERFVYHHGLWEGFRTGFTRYIRRGDAIIVLNNTNQKIYNEVLTQLQKVLEVESFHITPTQQIAFTLVKEGWSSAVELLDELAVNGTFSVPEQDDIMEITRLLIEMDKPALSSMVYNFFEKNFLVNNIAVQTDYID